MAAPRVHARHGLSTLLQAPPPAIEIIELRKSLYRRILTMEVAVGCGALRIIQAMLLWSQARRGFLRALSESQFLRSKNGRVAQQPAHPVEQWPIRRPLRPTAAD
jgi:hypothetical protein